MKICIPTMGGEGLDSQISSHFGRAPNFTIVDPDTKEVSIIDNTAEHFGGMATTPELIRSSGVDVMLVSGIGPRAVQLFEQMGIRVYVGAMGTARSALDAYNSGSLDEATDENVCAEHRR